MVPPVPVPNARMPHSAHRRLHAQFIRLGPNILPLGNIHCMRCNFPALFISHIPILGFMYSVIILVCRLFLIMRDIPLVRQPNDVQLPVAKLAMDSYSFSIALFRKTFPKQIIITKKRDKKLLNLPKTKSNCLTWRQWDWRKRNENNKEKRKHGSEASEYY